jgi:hypothetical protein
MLDIDAALAAAQLPERSVPLSLRGDLVAQVEVAERELEMLDRPADSLSSGGQRRAIAERIEALREEMRAGAVEFRMRALTRIRWSELLVAHPPRPDNNGDKLIGVNEDSFFGALIRECTVEPVLTEAQWTVLLDEKLTNLQYQTLADAVWSLNRRGVDIPFSPTASAILKTFVGE